MKIEDSHPQSSGRGEVNSVRTMSDVRTMSTIWREQRTGTLRPVPPQKHYSPRSEGLKLTTLSVMTEKLRLLESDIIELKAAVAEELPGATSMLSDMEKQLRLLKDKLQ